MEKSIEEQKIEGCISSIDEIINLHRQKLDLLEQHKKGLMQQLFLQKGETETKLKFKK
jgi:type I restriction enzyme S subunit